VDVAGDGEVDVSGPEPDVVEADAVVVETVVGVGGVTPPFSTSDKV